jgi:hypothetical protein
MAFVTAQPEALPAAAPLAAHAQMYATAEIANAAAAG